MKPQSYYKAGILSALIFVCLGYSVTEHVEKIQMRDLWMAQLDLAKAINDGGTISVTVDGRPTDAFSRNDLLRIVLAAKPWKPSHTELDRHCEVDVSGKRFSIYLVNGANDLIYLIFDREGSLEVREHDLCMMVHEVMANSTTEHLNSEGASF